MKLSNRILFIASAAFASSVGVAEASFDEPIHDFGSSGPSGFKRANVARMQDTVRADRMTEENETVVKNTWPALTELSLQSKVLKLRSGNLFLTFSPMSTTKRLIKFRLPSVSGLTVVKRPETLVL